MDAYKDKEKDEHKDDDMGPDSDIRIFIKRSRMTRTLMIIRIFS